MMERMEDERLALFFALLSPSRTPSRTHANHTHTHCPILCSSPRLLTPPPPSYSLPITTITAAAAAAAGTRRSLAPASRPRSPAGPPGRPARAPRRAPFAGCSTPWPGGTGCWSVLWGGGERTGRGVLEVNNREGGWRARALSLSSPIHPSSSLHAPVLSLSSSLSPAPRPGPVAGLPGRRARCRRRWARPRCPGCADFRGFGGGGERREGEGSACVRERPGGF